MRIKILVYQKMQTAEHYEALRSALAALGITQAEIAQAAGLDYQRLRKILSGIYPDKGELDRVEKAIVEYPHGT